MPRQGDSLEEYQVQGTYKPRDSVVSLAGKTINVGFSWYGRQKRITKVLVVFAALWVVGGAYGAITGKGAPPAAAPRDSFYLYVVTERDLRYDPPRLKRKIIGGPWSTWIACKDYAAQNGIDVVGSPLASCVQF